MSQASSASAVGTPTIPTQFTTDSGIAVPAAHNLNVLGGPGTSTTGSGSTITIAVSGAGFTWNVVTSANNTVTLALENGYIAKGGTAVLFKLPVTAAVGDTYQILGYGNLWSVSQNVGQTMTLGFLTTTVTTGTVTATAIRDSIEIVCVTANAEFQIIPGSGNLSFT
jgi:hypothetical protein